MKFVPLHCSKVFFYGISSLDDIRNMSTFLRLNWEKKASEIKRHLRFVLICPWKWFVYFYIFFLLIVKHMAKISREKKTYTLNNNNIMQFHLKREKKCMIFEIYITEHIVFIETFFFNLFLIFGVKWCRTNMS